MEDFIRIEKTDSKKQYLDKLERDLRELHDSEQFTHLTKEEKIAAINNVGEKMSEANYHQRVIIFNSWEDPSIRQFLQITNNLCQITIDVFPDPEGRLPTDDEDAKLKELRDLLATALIRYLDGHLPPADRESQINLINEIAKLINTDDIDHGLTEASILNALNQSDVIKEIMAPQRSNESINQAHKPSASPRFP